jgi:hypothetical protein
MQEMPPYALGLGALSCKWKSNNLQGPKYLSAAQEEIHSWNNFRYIFII